ncbi:hypothetical protein DOY81_014563, partial [Sarcophaga bullata]
MMLNNESQITATENENENDQTTKKNIVNNNETNSNSIETSSNSDNQNGNEIIEEGTGTVKTTLPAGKVIRRKKTPPQQGGNGNGNGNDIMSSSVTNTTTINNNNNRSNAMHRASLAKMEGLLTNSNDHLNVSSMSTSMEIEDDKHIDVTLPEWVVVGESVLIRPYNTSGIISYVG